MSININELSDKEKYFLLQISYIDLRPESLERMDRSIETMLRDALRIDRITIENKNKIKDLLVEFGELSEKNPSLKNLQIIDYENHNVQGNVTHSTKTGFVAYALEDENGNVGFLYRGSETESGVHWTKSLNDWTDNVKSGATGSSAQVKQANEFFERNARNDDVTYSIYGHSKGNNLASEVFVNNLDKDIYSYSVNGQPIYWYDLTNEQKEALRGDRYTFIVHQGDIVSGIGYVDYVDKVIDLEDPFQMNDGGVSLFYPHGFEGAEFDENGNFIAWRKPDIIGRQMVNTVAVAGNILKRVTYDYWSNRFQDPLGIAVMTGIGKDLYHYTIDTINVLWKYTSEKFHEGVQYVKEQFHLAITKLKDWGKEKIDQLKHWFDSFAEGVSDFFKGIGDWFRSCKPAMVLTAIDVNLVELRQFASRLQVVMNKISRVDQNLSSLVQMVDIEQKLSVIWVDMKVGYDYDLKRCIDYLNQTAQRLEDCERTLVQKALAL